MRDIICPNCGKAFQVDETGYADILKQVRDEEFDKQLHERLELAEREALDVAELEARLGRRLERAERARIGVGQLRRFLEHLLQRRYLENVPTIVPVL